MTSLRFQSVFDIIGPVMIGPSSSHTAGAVRIGKIVYSIFNDEPTEVEFQLFNSFDSFLSFLSNFKILLYKKRYNSFILQNKY